MQGEWSAEKGLLFSPWNCFFKGGGQGSGKTVSWLLAIGVAK